MSNGSKTSAVDDRILGALYGQALGDAFGMPAHATIEQTIAAFGWIGDFLPGPDDHPMHRGLPAGRITDDSEQAFSLARAFIDAGGVTLDAVINGIVQWYDRVDGDTSPYVGPSTRRGVQALRRGVDPHLTGVWGDTNGAAMRICPVGLLSPGDIPAAVEAAAITCIPTHNTNTAISGAGAVAAAIATAIAGAQLSELIEAAQLGAELGRKRGNPWMGASVAFRIRQAVEIAQCGDERTALRRLFDEIGTSLSIADTVGSAFGVLVLGRGDPHQTAVYAANLSGDADTIGAIACAMAGALAGFSRFSAQDIRVLENDEVFASYQVAELARGLQRLNAQE